MKKIIGLLLLLVMRSFATDIVDVFQCENIKPNITFYMLLKREHSSTILSEYGKVIHIKSITKMNDDTYYCKVRTKGSTFRCFKNI